MAVNLGSTFKELIDEINGKLEKTEAESTYATKSEVETAIGNIDTLLTALDTGAGV